MPSTKRPMTAKQPANVGVTAPDSTSHADERVRFDQVLRRLVDAKLKKPAPKPAKPPRKL